MLGMLFETGHPWLAFKDPCNVRYTNRHLGTVHTSNLCTEITLHTNDQEIAVCNLGSVNLAAHVNERGLDTDRLAKTINTAMRMLDDVIDYNYYSVSQARNANMRHRPVGLGIMGFQDALHKLRISYASEEAVRFADRSMEAISYYAIRASTDLAKELGRYPSFEGSLWSRGILPIDSIAHLEEGRGGTAFEIDPRWLVEAASRRQKWLDQAQSLNLYMREPNGKKLDNLYKLAWVRGLKTTYYLRSLGATHLEKSTMEDAAKASQFNAVGGDYPSDKGNGSGEINACSVLNPECEACQ